MKRRLLISLLCLSLSTGAPADGLPDLGESAQSDISPQMERRIGEQFMREVRYREPSYVSDAEVEDYLNQLGRRLAAHAPAAGQDFEFFALRDPTLNAFAWPGGFIGVHTGLIVAAESESELASVLSHEIAHVTQRHIVRMVSKQSQASMAMLAGLIVALLAGRNSSQVAEAAIVGTQAAVVQNQLSYTRDFEREADRMGMQILESSGLDVRAMPSFFERLQKGTRLYENNAPSYLRTHPLTSERIADVGNRVQSMPYRQVPDSMDFQLVRAKLRAGYGTARDAQTDFTVLLKDRKLPEPVARYGLARAHLRAKDVAAAERELAELRRLEVASPMVDMLAAEIRLAREDMPGALQVFASARIRYPQSRALLYGHVEALLRARQPEEALKVVSGELAGRTQETKLFELQSRSYAALGKRAAQHRAQAEVYVLQGNLVAAVEQLQIAQRSGDGDFYEQSAVDARLRELKARQAEEAKQKL